MTYLKDFKEKILADDYLGFLKIWEEYCFGDTPEADELIEILKITKDSDLAKSFGQHVDKALLLLDHIQDKNKKHEILKLIFDIQNKNTSELAEIAFNYLQEKYSNDKYFDDKIRLIGLRSQDEFQGAISHYELLSHLAKGKSVFHTGGWGTGEICDISLIREELTLEFENVIGKKHMSFHKAINNLLPLADNHFLARRFGDPDKLEKEAKEDPAELMKLLLKDLGPKNASEIKDELYDLVIPPEDWARWWQNARLKIKKDTMIESPNNLKKPFKIRKKELSHEESLYKALEAKPNIDEIIQMIYSFLKSFPETLKNHEFRSSLETKLKEVIENEDPSNSQKLELAFLIEDLSSNKEYPLLKELVKNTKTFKEDLKQINIISLKKRALILARKERDDWEPIFLEELFNIDQNIIRDYLLLELSTVKNKNQLEEKIKDLLYQPITYPQVFVWYFKKIIEQDNKSKLPFSNELGKNKFFEGFLILLDHISNKVECHELVKKMIKLITHDKFKLVRDRMATSSEEEVKEYMLLASKCRVLSDHDIKIFNALAEVVYPSLKIADTASENEHIIWTTQEGYEKAKNRIQQIATVETLENAKEIEEARSHGDLRENAEYKAALEKRSRLQGELKFISDQLNQARILNPRDINLNKVGIGSIVNCVDSKGQKTSFTLLGPWDANPEKNIISFQSKLAQSMTDLAVGDSFNFQNDEYKIESIGNFFK